MHIGKLFGRLLLILVVIIGTLMLFMGVLGIISAELEGFGALG